MIRSRLRLLPSLAAVALAVAASACGPSRMTVPPGTLQPDRFLFERGTEALNERRWLTAREFFRQVTDVYTQSPYRPEAKLGIGDTYLGEGSQVALVQAINEFREFLTFFPTHARADYAQFRLALCYFRQMRAPQRDQTETRAAILEFETFIARYPNSDLLPEARTHLREARDRLSTSEFEVGRHYFRVRWYPGAVERLTKLLKDDPAYSRRDAVYFYLGETLVRMGRDAEALPYFQKLLAEFEASEHIRDARARVMSLKGQTESG